MEENSGTSGELTREGIPRKVRRSGCGKWIIGKGIQWLFRVADATTGHISELHMKQISGITDTAHVLDVPRAVVGGSACRMQCRCVTSWKIIGSAMVRMLSCLLHLIGDNIQYDILIGEQRKDPCSLGVLDE